MSSVILVCTYWYVLYSRIYKIDIFFSQFPLLGLTSSVQFMYNSPIGAAPILISMKHSRGAFSKWVTTNLSKQRVYLGVRTCELFLCFAPFVFLGPIVLTSLFSFVSFPGSYTEDESKQMKWNRSTQFTQSGSWFHFKQNILFFVASNNINSPLTFALIYL